MDNGTWIRVTDRIPPRNIVVDTKVEDDGPARNERQLKLIGSLWFYADGSAYVYYEPTHWRMPESSQTIKPY